MKIRPTVIRLIPEGNPRGSVACRRSHKSANCHAATEWQDRKTDMRMKPELVEQQSSGTYQGCDTSAISRLTDERCIRQSVMLVITPAKWGLPKPKRRKAIEVVLEYSAWQRSFRSSPSRVMPCTWRREAVI